MKTNGAIWKKFYAEAFPKESWHEDETLLVNGIDWADKDPSDVSDSDLIELTGGVFFRSQSDVDGVSFTAYFKKWLNSQNETSVLCYVPKDKIQIFLDYCKSIKVKTR